MKRLFFISFLSFYVLGCLAQDQKPYKNRAFMGFSFFGDVPLFNFAFRGYTAGLGGSWTVLSPKITLSDSNQLWLRFGGSINSGRQGSGQVNLPDGYAKIRHSYTGLNLLARLSKEKAPKWRPFAEVAFVWNVFESQYSRGYTGNHIQIYDPSVFYHGYLPGVSLAGGYMYRITDGFLLEAKLSYLQGFEQIRFPKADQVVLINGNYKPDVRHAAPSMLFLHIGILFRLPPITGTSSPRTPSTLPPPDSPNPPPTPTPPNKDRKYNYTW